MKREMSEKTSKTIEWEWSEQINSNQSDLQKLIRILHIDDDSSCLMFTKQFLEKHDPLLIIESAVSVDKALELLEGNQFDCIVSDFKMPKIGGVELADEIRAHVKETVPFIFYTGKCSSDDVSAAFAAGVDDYLQKELDPSHYQVLAKRIRSAVEKRSTERLFKNILERSRNAIVIVIGSTIELANQAAADLFEVSGRDDLVGRDITRLIVEEEKKHAEDTTPSIERGSPKPGLYELTIRRGGGELRLVEISSSQIEYGGKPATLCFISCITERKQIEEKLREYEEKLEKMVEKKSREIVENERKATVSEVTSGLDHDLRSPLQTIKNAVFLLRQSPEENENILEMINGAVDRIVAILNELLQNARVHTK